MKMVEMVALHKHTPPAISLRISCGSALQRTLKKRQKGNENKDVLSVVSLALFSPKKKIASAAEGHEAALHLETCLWF